MDRGCGLRRTAKSHRGMWVEEDMAMKYADTIKVRRQSNLNQRRKVFMNLQFTQHREDKVIFVHEAFEVKLIG